MKLYYIDRKTQIKHFSDLKILENLSAISQLSLNVPSQEDFIVQIATLPEDETEILEITTDDNSQMYCINTHVTDKFGKTFEKSVSLTSGNIQPLFFVIPSNNENNGNTSENVIIFRTDKGQQMLTVNVNFTNEKVENKGYNDLCRLSRLNWLNSTRFLNNSPVAPYFVPEINGNTVRVLGRDITFGKNALPEQAAFYYDESIQVTGNVQKKLFRSPMEFLIDSENAVYEQPKIINDNGSVLLCSKAQTDSVKIEINGILHYEGSIDYSITVTALKDFSTDNISLKSEINSDCSEYMNGLGEVGGKSKNLNFSWNSEKHHDCLYICSVNAGLRIKWKAENYVKPLINIYYKNMPLNVPVSTWDNNSNGNIIFSKNENTSSVIAQTGDFKMSKGEIRNFNFEIHFTPLKPIDYKKHYKTRYDHNNNLKNEIKEADRASKLGLNYMVIHHGNMVHPFINYPFIETEKLKNLVDYAKQKDVGVKVYYTTREHSNNMAEVFAYKALGDEIILRKKGKGYSWHGGTAKWLTEYFGEEIIPAWKVEYKTGKYKNTPDVSFIVRPNSRLDNYYIEGLDWLVKNIGIKGIYIDDTALDRTTLERAKKVLSQNNGLIDMHMWNHEEDRAGDVSCMNLYTELFPFIDSLWIGEGYPYKKLSPEYLLTEVSGITYGQTSQMLEGGGNPYIGMLYAMNNRYGWGAKDAPRIYSLWDSFGIENSEMRGYWHSKNPITTENESIRTTVYVKKDSALVCMFNFSDKKTTIYPKIDESLLGFKVNDTRQAYIKKLQKDKSLNLAKGIKLKGKDGIIFIISK